MLIEYYGVTQEITGSNQQNIALQKDTDALLGWLQTQYPALLTLPLLLAVNNEIIQQNTCLKDSDRIAVMPPFSGG